MSIRLIVAVFDRSGALGLRPTEVLLLIALAEHCDDTRFQKAGVAECWPSARRLAKRTRLNLSTVTRVLRTLKQRGLIVVTRGSGRRSSRYRLDLSARSVCMVQTQEDGAALSLAHRAASLVSAPRRPRGGVVHTDPVVEPETKDQDQRRSRAAARSEEAPRVLEVLAHQVRDDCDRGTVAPSDVVEELKQRAARAGLRYDGDRISKVLTSTEHQRARAGGAARR